MTENSIMEIIVASLCGMQEKVYVKKWYKKNSIFSLNRPLKGRSKAVAPATLHLSTRETRVSRCKPTQHLFLRSGHERGGSAATLEKQVTHRIDCVIIAVIQSGPHTHTRVESRRRVPDQLWPDWRRMRRRPVGTRWPSGSCVGPRSVSLPRQPCMITRVCVKAFIKIYNGMYVCDTLIFFLMCGRSG